jgi:formylglycine-generating enzyme required for sulfatase activity
MSPRKSSLSLNQKITISIAVLAIVVTIFTAFISGHDWFQSPPQTIVTLTSQSSVAVNQTAPSITLQPQTTSTPSPIPTKTFTPTPLPPELTDYRGVKMVLVPAGTFTMGMNGSYIAFAPAHTVNLTSYYIDKYEVTNAHYRDCVNAGACTPPKQLNSSNRPKYYDNFEFDNYPVVYVDWIMADNYCKWREASLPTEAQWEMAAGGTDNGSNKQAYPWEGKKINSTYANYNNSNRDTVAIGSYPLGVSPYGVYDMAGNVWEWVRDSINFKTPSYTDPSGVTNPIGQPDAGAHVLRGGGWDTKDTLFLNVASRGYQPDSTVRPNLGFRCGRDVNP